MPSIQNEFVLSNFLLFLGRGFIGSMMPFYNQNYAKNRTALQVFRVKFLCKFKSKLSPQLGWVQGFIRRLGKLHTQSFFSFLFFRLVGCQALLEDFPARSDRRSSLHAVGSPGENKTLSRSSKSFHSKSVNKYSLEEKLSSEYSLGLSLYFGCVLYS